MNNLYFYLFIYFFAALNRQVKGDTRETKLNQWKMFNKNIYPLYCYFMYLFTITKHF